MSGILLVAAMDRELFPVPGTVAMCCGIGPVEAAVATSRALAEHQYCAVLHVGIAGAVTLAPGTVVLGSESVYCDVLDVNSTRPRIARLAADAALLARAQAAMPDLPAVPIATAARVGGGAGYEVEAMEGFGGMRAADRAGIPALEVRAISNLVANADRSEWQIDSALNALRDAIARLVPSLL